MEQTIILALLLGCGLVLSVTLVIAWIKSKLNGVLGKIEEVDRRVDESFAEAYKLHEDIVRNVSDMQRRNEEDFSKLYEKISEEVSEVFDRVDYINDEIYRSIDSRFDKHINNYHIQKKFK